MGLSTDEVSDSIRANQQFLQNIKDNLNFIHSNPANYGVSFDDLIKEHKKAGKRLNKLGISKRPNQC